MDILLYNYLSSIFFQSHFPILLASHVNTSQTRMCPYMKSEDTKETKNYMTEQNHARPNILQPQTLYNVDARSVLPLSLDS